MTEVFNVKDRIDLSALTQTFIEISPSEPGTKLQNHLISLTSLWMKRDGLYFQELLTTMTQKILPRF